MVMDHLSSRHIHICKSHREDVIFFSILPSTFPMACFSKVLQKFPALCFGHQPDIIKVNPG